MDKDTLSETPSYRWPFIAAVIAVVIVLALYIDTFNGWWWLKDWNGLPNFKVIESDWGAFGDYFGGVLNPIIGLITIWFLGKTLRQGQISMAANQKALMAQVKQAERQSNIQTVSMLIETFSRQIAEIEDFLADEGGAIEEDGDQKLIKRVMMLEARRKLLDEYLMAVEAEIVESFRRE